MRTMPRLLVMLATLIVGVGLIAPSASAVSGVDQSSDESSGAVVTTTTIDNSFLDTERPYSECVSALPDPDCGREPTAEGDRGGALQLVTFGVLTLGIAFIVWRVVRSVRARDAAVTPRG